MKQPTATVRSGIPVCPIDASFSTHWAIQDSSDRVASSLPVPLVPLLEGQRLSAGMGTRQMSFDGWWMQQGSLQH